MASASTHFAMTALYVEAAAQIGLRGRPWHCPVCGTPHHEVSTHLASAFHYDKVAILVFGRTGGGQLSENAVQDMVWNYEGGGHWLQVHFVTGAWRVGRSTPAPPTVLDLGTGLLRGAGPPPPRTEVPPPALPLDTNAGWSHSHCTDPTCQHLCSDPMQCNGHQHKQAWPLRTLPVLGEQGPCPQGWRKPGCKYEGPPLRLSPNRPVDGPGT